MPYDMSSRGYMKRARARLEEGTQEGLFYAAFELRAAIENRLRQYMETQDVISKKALHDYKIKKLGKRVERAFRVGDKVAKVSITRYDTGELLATFYYTPVTLSLRKKAEKLGAYLHGMTKHRQDDDSWWESTRQFLETTYEELAEAHKGTLLGPPLYDRSTGTASITAEHENGDGQTQTMMDQMRTLKGERMHVVVDYLDKFPDSK